MVLACVINLQALINMTQIMFNQNDHMIHKEQNQHDTFFKHILKNTILSIHTHTAHPSA